MLKVGPTLGWFTNILFQNKNRAENLKYEGSDLQNWTEFHISLEILNIFLHWYIIHIYRRSIFSFDRYFFNFKGLQSQQNCHQPRQPSPITSRGRVPILLRAGRSNRGQQFHPFLHLYLLFWTIELSENQYPVQISQDWWKFWPVLKVWPSIYHSMCGLTLNMNHYWCMKHILHLAPSKNLYICFFYINLHLPKIGQNLISAGHWFQYITLH